MSVGCRLSGLQKRRTFLMFSIQAWKPAEPQQQPSWKKRTNSYCSLALLVRLVSTFYPAISKQVVGRRKSDEAFEPPSEAVIGNYSGFIKSPGPETAAEEGLQTPNLPQIRKKVAGSGFQSALSRPRVQFKGREVFLRISFTTLPTAEASTQAMATAS